MRLPTAIVALAVLVLGTPLVAQDWQTISTSRQFHAEEKLVASVEFLTGSIRIHAADARTLYQAQMRYDADRFRARNRYYPSSNYLRIGLDVEHLGGDIEFDEGSPQYLDLALPLAVPTDLRMEFGAAYAELELGGLSISRATIKTGASKTSLRFSSANRVDCRQLEVQAAGAHLELAQLANSRCRRVAVTGGAGEITLDFTGSWADGMEMIVHAKMGLGQLTLRIPEDVGVRVDLDRLLVGFDKAGFIKRGSRWYSPNFDSAAAQISFEIDAAFGDIDVVWVRQGR